MRALALLILAAACGRGSDGELGGGGANLPVSGVGPYRKLADFAFATPLEEPFVVTLPGTDLGDPAPLVDGDRVRIYYTRGDAIYGSDLPASFDALPEPPRVVLAASEPWEAGAVLAPTLVDDDDQVVLYYQGRDGGIGRAESTDRGESFVKTGQVLAAGNSPGALHTRLGWFLYHGRADAAGIFVATSADGRTFAARAEPVLPGGESPAAAGGDTAAGEHRIALTFDVPGTGSSRTVGTAASSDGVSFEIRAEPLFAPAPPSERQAAVVLGPARAILFFAQEASGKLAIAVATSP